MKTTKGKVNVAKVAPVSEEIEEVVAVDEAVEEVAEVSINPSEDLVRVAVNKLIDPAPRVGGVCLVRDFGMSKLTPGVHSLPRVIAEVLVDKKLAQFV